MTASDWLLLLFDGAERPLDRVRIQKAMFLFAMRSKADDSEKYEFVPYNYGPFSFEIYPDLAHFERAGWIEDKNGRLASFPAYMLTLAGERRASELKMEAPTERLEFLRGIRSWVQERGFSRLLDDIYERYPEFAVNSVFRR